MKFDLSMHIKFIIKHALAVILAGIFATKGYAGAPTAEEIYGSTEGGSRDFGFFETLLLIAFYGPFIYSLLKDKSTRRMIFFLAGSMGALIYIASNLKKEDGVLFLLAFLVFWMIAGDRITGKIMEDKKSDLNSRVDEPPSKNSADTNPAELFKPKEIKALPKENISITVPQPKLTSIYKEETDQKKSVSTSNSFPVISGRGWKYDKRARVLWNPGTKEILTNWDGLGYSVNEVFLTLHNKETPRKISKNEVEEAVFDWTHPYQ